MPESNQNPAESIFSQAVGNPEARSAKPMNEADDFELLRALHEGLTAELVLLWSAASAETKKLLSVPQGMSDQQLAAAIANAWKDPIVKAESCRDVAEHLLFRAESLRCHGILSGDPREAKALSFGE